LEQGQIGKEKQPASLLLPGRPLEFEGDFGPRLMIASLLPLAGGHRTRLIVCFGIFDKGLRKTPSPLGERVGVRGQ